MPRTLTAPPTDRRYWRRLLRVVHPDAGGDGDLFVWTRALQEYVAGDAIEPPPRDTRRQPPQHPQTGERIPYEAAFDKAGSFHDLTMTALQMADTVPEVYARLLRLLGDCVEAGPEDVAGYRSQHAGATYKQLAYAAHLAGLDAAERREWYAVAES